MPRPEYLTFVTQSKLHKRETTSILPSASSFKAASAWCEAHPFISFENLHPLHSDMLNVFTCGSFKLISLHKDSN